MNENGMMRDFVISKFQELYEKRWKNRGKNQIQFAMAIQRELPETKCSSQNVSNWYTGKQRPGKKYLPTICKLLGVDESEFSPKTHDERYKYNPDYADDVQEYLEKMAENNFGIDLTFFQGIKNIIPDFDEKYPVFAPLHRYGLWAYAPDGRERKPYERSVPAEASETSHGIGLFQIVRDGKTYFLTRYDLKIISEIQAAIKACIYDWFDKLAADYQKAEADVNLLYTERNAGDIIWEEWIISDNELQKIDSHGIYTEKEEKKYKLPPLIRVDD